MSSSLIHTCFRRISSMIFRNDPSIIFLPNASLISARVPAISSPMDLAIFLGILSSMIKTSAFSSFASIIASASPLPSSCFKASHANTSFTSLILIHSASRTSSAPGLPLPLSTTSVLTPRGYIDFFE